LQTKIIRPPVPDDYVARSEVVLRLNRSLASKLALVVAPSGYGKSSLVSDWLRGLALPSAWYSVSDDDDVTLFLAYLVASIRALYPDACPTTRQMLTAPVPVPLSDLCAHLVNEISAIGNVFVLAIDDYQRVHDTGIHEAMAYLIRRQPPNLRLAMMTREDPPLPLPRMRARGEVVEVRAAQLRFTREETAVVLASMMRRPVSESEVVAVDEVMEGWAAGLRLACLPSAGMAGGLRNAQTFLMSEVLQRQPPEVQDFLVKTSILAEFCASLATAVVTGMTANDDAEAEALIERLVRANLFMVPMDMGGQWYRYHHLFAVMLRRQLQQRSSPAEVAGLHRHASEWLSEHGRVEEAIRHALQSGDEDRACMIVERHSLSALNREELIRLARWIQMLPERVVEQWPVVKSLETFVRYYRTSPHLRRVARERAEAAFAASEPRIDPDKKPILRMLRATMRVNSSLLLAEFQNCVTDAEEALALMPPSHTFTCGRIQQLWGLGMQGLGRGQIGRVRLLETWQNGPSTGNLGLLHGVAGSYMLDGDLDNMNRVAEQLSDAAERNGADLLKAWGDYYSGFAAFQWHEMQAACAHFERVIRSDVHLVSQFLAGEAVAFLALARQALGDTHGAREALDLLAREGRSDLAEWLDSLAARLALLQGDLKRALQWAESFTGGLPRYHLVTGELPYLTQARIRIAEGSASRVAAGLAQLDELLDVAQAAHNTWCQLRILPIRAVARRVLGRDTAALDDMRRAVTLAHEGRWVWTFVEAGPVAAALLRQVADRTPAANGGFVEHVLSAFPQPSGEHTGGPGLLSEREREVLALLAERLTDREIAVRLSVSVDTVKKHCGHIYNKLGASNRREAVAHARELGLLRG
jgi:LuxR family maltose regulon positive regulatory protein